MKKIVALLLSLLMLTALFVPVSATADSVIGSEVLYSITEEEETGTGLGFQFTLDVKNTKAQNGTFVSANATIDGTTYKVVKLGAMVTNQAETGKNPDAMVIENATGISLLNVEATNLWSWSSSMLTYAVRVIDIPTKGKKIPIYVRPYYIYEKDGKEVVVYGDTASKSHYSYWCSQNPVTLPEIGTDIDVIKQKNRIRVSDATIVDRTVTLTFTNYSTNWITEEVDYVEYTCYDKNGNKLTSAGKISSTAKLTGTIYIGSIDTKKNKTKSFTFVVPDNTAKVALTGSSITYWTEWS